MRGKRYPLIAIEGVDGVGKTTLAKKLAETCNAKYIKTPLKVTLWFVRLAEKSPPTVEILAYWFATIITSLYITHLLKKYPVICDKYILNTIVSQTVLTKKRKLLKVLTALRYTFIKRPDYTICLIVDTKEELKKRFSERHGMDQNDKALFPYWAKIQLLYKAFPEVQTVNTTQKDAEWVFQHARKIFSHLDHKK